MVYQLYRDIARWRSFFLEAEAFLETAPAIVQENPPVFLQAVALVRIMLLSRGIASFRGRLLSVAHPWRARQSEIRFEIVSDADLPTDEGRRWYCSALINDAVTPSPLRSQLGVSTHATARCTTEQEEPLLLLPDYIAGAFHHADPQTTLGMPVVTAEGAASVVEDFRRRHVRFLLEKVDNFDRVFPVDYDTAGNLISRW